MTASREEVCALVHELKALSRPDIAALQAKLDERAADAFWKANPRRRKKPELKIARAWEGYKPLFDEASTEMKEINDRYRSESERLGQLIFEAVRDGARPRAGEQKAQLGRTISSTDYSTQGFGAVGYARGSAENLADHARFYDIPVVVTSETKECGKLFATGLRGGRDSYQHFRVIVSVEDAVVDPVLIDLGPGPGIIEQVRMCWARGCNPRVLNPFLPPGFEEKHGLNYFGGRRG